AWVLRGRAPNANMKSTISPFGEAAPRQPRPPSAPEGVRRLCPPVQRLPSRPDPPPGAAAAELPGPRSPPVPPTRARDGPGWLPRRGCQWEDRLLRDHDLARQDALPRAVLRASRDADPRGRAASAHPRLRRAPSRARARP